MTRVAGYPREHFPRPSPQLLALNTMENRYRLVIDPLSDDHYDAELDKKYIENILGAEVTENGVFGTTIHWQMVRDAERRLRSYLERDDLPLAETFLHAYPNLSYIWLRRRDKIAQAVSWHKAIQTGIYVKTINRVGTDRLAEASTFAEKKIRMLLSVLRCSDNGWRFFFTSNNLNPLVLFYEDVANDLNRAVRLTLEFLHIELEDLPPIASPYVKCADEESADWVKMINDRLPI